MIKDPVNLKRIGWKIFQPISIIKEHWSLNPPRSVGWYWHWSLDPNTGVTLLSLWLRDSDWDCSDSQAALTAHKPPGAETGWHTGWRGVKSFPWISRLRIFGKLLHLVVEQFWFPREVISWWARRLERVNHLAPRQGEARKTHNRVILGTNQIYSETRNRLRIEMKLKPI